MTLDEAADLLEDLLAEAPADPAGTWEAFREWARHPVACERDEVSASLGYADGGAWVEFRRTFEDINPAASGSIALCLSSARPDAPRLPEVREVCEGRADLSAFFARVEDLPGFTAALRYPHWEFDAEREG
jgi:hypothetical protein